MQCHSLSKRLCAVLAIGLGLGWTVSGCHPHGTDVASLYGIPIYPGATKPAGSEGGNTLPPENGLAMAVLETPDAPQKVVAFYKENLVKPRISQYNRNGAPVVSLSDVRPDNSVRNVRVFDENGKTAIEMMSVQPQPSGKPVILPGP